MSTVYGARLCWLVSGFCGARFYLEVLYQIDYLPSRENRGKVGFESRGGAGEFLKTLTVAIGTKLDGIIGHNFLDQFKVTIDYPRKALELAAGT